MKKLHQGSHAQKFVLKLPQWLPGSGVLLNSDEVKMEISYYLGAQLVGLHTSFKISAGQLAVTIPNAPKQGFRLQQKLTMPISTSWFSQAQYCLATVNLPQTNEVTRGGHPLAVQIICDNSHSQRAVKSFKIKLVRRHFCQLSASDKNKVCQKEV